MVLQIWQQLRLQQYLIVNGTCTWYICMIICVCWMPRSEELLAMNIHQLNNKPNTSILMLRNEIWSSYQSIQNTSPSVSCLQLYNQDKRRRFWKILYIQCYFQPVLFPPFITFKQFLHIWNPSKHSVSV